MWKLVIVLCMMIYASEENPLGPKDPYEFIFSLSMRRLISDLEKKFKDAKKMGDENIKIFSDGVTSSTAEFLEKVQQVETESAFTIDLEGIENRGDTSKCRKWYSNPSVTINAAIRNMTKCINLNMRDKAKYIRTFENVANDVGAHVTAIITKASECIKGIYPNDIMCASKILDEATTLVRDDIDGTMTDLNRNIHQLSKTLESIAGGCRSIGLKTLEQRAWTIQREMEKCILEIDIPAESLSQLFRGQ